MSRVVSTARHSENSLSYSMSAVVCHTIMPPRPTLNTRGANRGFTPEDPLFTLTVDADTAKKYYKRLGIKFFPTRYKLLTMVVYIT